MHSSDYELIINEIDFKMLIEHAKRNYPFEACALLFGKIKGNTYRVNKVLLAENILNSSVSFKIDENFLLNAYENAEKEGLDLVAIFHSHPALPYPSSLDKKFMALNPVPWVILSMPSLDFKAHIFKNNSFIEVHIVREEI
ncbi:MAG: M67 family metallopeptidase [Nitrososphaerales archaeon]